MISIIIPVYNDALYFRECLYSIQSQCYQNYEVIIVNDGSTDNSQTIAQQLCYEDKRFHLYNHTENKGTLLARQTGINASKGTYCCFLDADDKLASNRALKTMVSHMKKEAVDILQFSVSPFGSRSKGACTAVSSWFSVYPFKLMQSKRILEDCFEKGLYNWNICGKVFRTHICRKAFQQLDEIYCVMAEDAYAFFLISVYSSSFKGISTKPLYAYRLTSGISTKHKMTLLTFHQHIHGESQVLQSIKQFLLRQNLFAAYSSIVFSFEKRILQSTASNYYNLPIKQRDQAFVEWLQYCSCSHIMHSLWETDKSSFPAVLHTLLQSKMELFNSNPSVAIGKFVVQCLSERKP